MKKKIITLLACGLLLSACAGRTPNPVPLHQPGDESLTCNALKLELMNNQTKITNLIPQQNKMVKNIALGVAGAFIIAPWFFMDFSDAERVEIQSYQLRDNWLRTLYAKKNCGRLPPAIKFQDQ